MIMAELRELENNYPKDYRTAFEDLTTLIFCTYLHLSHGVNRRVNQKGIECDPVTIKDRTYSFQSKYYDAATRLSDKKTDFINSIEIARQKGVTNLLFFVNKDLTEANKKTDEEPQYLKDVYEAAKGNDERPEVVLEWWTLSKIESTLDMDAYRYIQKIYIGDVGSEETGYFAFYDYVYDRFCKNFEKELYGDVSFRNSYIEPSVNVKNPDGSNKSIREYLESWVDSNGSIAVIIGEPGHGKTSLCQKAMCDFYTEGWLSGRVNNVFCFSLNPANTDALANDSFYLYSLLSWGDDRKSTDQKIKKKDCENALIFFDGFDELLEWHPRFNLKSFIEQYIVPFQSNLKNSHVIITSRKMAVEPLTAAYELDSRICVPVIELQLITKNQQIKWIEDYVDHYRVLKENASHTEKEKSEIALRELINYLQNYKQLLYDGDLQDILGIPIIFRMFVAARYLPENHQPITKIYDNLFHITWARRRHNQKDASTDPESEAKAQLSLHAIKIYADNNDTAKVNRFFESSWLYSFYTTHGGEKRVGFLHRSFYQYFLAKEITSWFFNFGLDERTLEKKLSYLSVRKLDSTTLSYIFEIYDNDRTSFEKGIEQAYKILKSTDGIFELLQKGDSQNETDTLSIIGSIEKVKPLQRANNIFWNVLSICSTCKHPVTRDNINVNTLTTYNMSGCHMVGAQFEEAKLWSANFSKARLNDANFSKAELPRAYLRNANLLRADFSSANLRGASLRLANLESAVFYGADLTGADIRSANLKEADLRYAIINHIITGDGICLKNAKINESDKFKWDSLGIDTSVMTVIPD